jgi:hypothetical protein
MRFMGSLTGLYFLGAGAGTGGGLKKSKVSGLVQGFIAEDLKVLRVWINLFCPLLKQCAFLPAG